MHKTPIQISVAVITKNEEENIGRCLDSVEEIADEVVIIDSFSTDKTRDICLAHKAHFFENKFEGHIEQKNFAISKCRYNFVLSLDADEVLSPQAIQDINRLKKNAEFDGYSFHRLTRYCGKWIRHSGWYPDSKLRLWNKHLGSWQGTNPHDRFVMTQDARIKNLDSDILHYSINSISEHLQTVESFSTIAAKAKFDRGRKFHHTDTLIRPAWKFFRNYFIKMGFLDGYEGFLVCRISAFATFLRYSKLRELYKNSKQA